MTAGVVEKLSQNNEDKIAGTGPGTNVGRSGRRFTPNQ
jgi:hypothetical protein